MLQKGQLGMMIWVRVAIFAVMLILLFYSAKIAYDALLQPEQDRTSDLAYRLDFLVNQALSGSPAVERQYSRNTFIISGEPDKAIVLFSEKEQTISVYRGADTLSYTNPCEGACICTVDAGRGGVSRRKCTDLPITDTTIVRLQPERNDPRLSGPTAEARLYPRLPGTQLYSDAFIAFSESSRELNHETYEPLALYLEYTPPMKNGASQTQQLLLVTPYTADRLQTLKDRESYLDVCTRGDQECRDRPKGSAVGDDTYCRDTGTQCTLTRVDRDCSHGTITEACTCDGKVRDTGFCVIQGADQEWYEPARFCLDTPIQNCVSYCGDDGCNLTEQHACTWDLCSRTAHYCTPTPATCRQSMTDVHPSYLLADTARQLLGGGEGYRYAIIELPEPTDLTNPPRMHSIVGFGGQGQAELYHCLEDAEACYSLFNNYIDGTTPIGTGPVDTTTPGPRLCSWRNENTLPSTDGEIDFTRFEHCTALDSDTIILGTDRRIWAPHAEDLLEAPGPYFGLVYTPRRGVPTLVQARVFADERPSILSIGAYSPSHRLYAAHLGCQDYICPPFPES